MKILVKTKIITIEGGEHKRSVYLPVEGVAYSAIDLGDSWALVRVSGNKRQIEQIRKDSSITILSDKTALELLTSINKTAELCNIDIMDNELDELSLKVGLEPGLRANIQTPAKTGCLLQSQEKYLMSHICKKIGLTKKEWNVITSTTGKWINGKALEDAIIAGNNEAYVFVLNKIHECLNEKRA